MSQESGIRIFREAGEAIGNVGRRVFRRRKARQVEEAIERWSELLPLPTLSSDGERRHKPNRDVIDASYRIITNDEEKLNGLESDRPWCSMKGDSR